MTALHKNRVQMSVASVGADPYTITLDAASSGHQSLATAYAGNATVDILITMGTTWEVARGCTYTHVGTTVTRGTFEDSSTGSRITTFDNTAVVSVIFTAGKGNLVESALLENLAASPTTAGVTGVVGTMHLLDISGLTAARDFTLPTTATTGDRIGVFCTTDAPTTAAYVLQIKSGAAGDLINGVDHSSTIWSSLFIKGETLIFRCINGSTADWIVEHDGRIPVAVRINNTYTHTSTSLYQEVDFSGATVIGVSSYVNTADDSFSIRRKGFYLTSFNMSMNFSASAKALAYAAGNLGGAYWISYTKVVPAANGTVTCTSSDVRELLTSDRCAIEVQQNDSTSETITWLAALQEILR